MRKGARELRRVEQFGRMLDTRRLPVVRWTVDYGDGSRPSEVIVPHAWRQDMPVSYEGPVRYRTTIEVPRGEPHLLFHGISYAAEISVDGEPVLTHRGLWDAFAVPLDRWVGQTVPIEVAVIKNGGASYPVRDVASGFLPFVYHTFGGFHGRVELLRDAPVLDHGPAASRVHVDGHRIYVDGRPFYMRGLLHWGWYPEVGHVNAPEETIRQEVRDAKALGFNLVKFCLWVPPQRYLEILREEGMFAWMELPLWDPSGDAERQAEIADELERIVRQYRHHDNVVVWTVGCELSASTPAEYRRYLTQMVRNLTHCPLVKDNSGGAEMYGGDLREYGDCYDFHPYCDTPFYPAVLDTLLPAARRRMPILLGEFNDIDVHRDLARTGDELPYWASTLPELNEKGVRWQYDLPNVLDTSRFATQPSRSGHASLMESSRRKALYIRKTVQETVRARDAIAGYVITGWRDTPISSAGFFDDWGAPRFSPAEVAPWNGPDVLFLIPTRRPPWVTGGNRPGFLYSQCQFTGQVYWRVGLHSETGARVGLTWSIRDANGRLVAQGADERLDVPALESTEIGQIHWECDTPGEYVLRVEAGATHNEWPIWVVPPLGKEPLAGWSKYDPSRLLDDLAVAGGPNLIATRPPADLSERLARGERVLLFATEEVTQPVPFWRESAYEFHDEEFWASVPFAERWERFYPISGDQALDEAWLRTNVGEYEVLMNRVDVRTYVESPALIRAGGLIATTLRPFGGLGTQPTALARNAAGVELLRALVGL
jgi:hypothetical protein